MHPKIAGFSRIRVNIAMIDAFRKLRQIMRIVFLTPTIYDTADADESES